MRFQVQMPRFRFKDPNSDRNKRAKDFSKIQEKRKKTKKKKDTDDDEIEKLRKTLWPDFGDEKKDLQTSDIKQFSDLPISKKTLKGLDLMKFSKPTDIQRESMLFALQGHDILGAAKTGSGKTLAFLIPILETLFRQRYSPTFGMAALVISPTRELAYQSYDVLRKIGRFHLLSFGLAIGGMFLREEAKKMHSTNVVICTPGRLLQHFEQTPNFTADELKVLVLDEADKILDLGFEETMNSIMEALPRQRQTLLFSATQTKSVKSLARLSLKKPIYVSVHEKAKEVTPTTLNQRYIVCEQHNKLNMLWSFIKSHKLKKMLVFLSSCKEVRHLYQVFKRMRPGLTILCLHGHMKQLQRMEAYETFSKKKNVVMLATDVAARGLDFPVVHWVVQVDKPENVDTYIHRVGRTARYDRVGEALLMLMPSEEEKMVSDLQKRKIPVVKLKVAKKRMFDVTKKLESFCAADQEIKNNAQKAFISVMKTLFVLDKAAFNQIDTDAYAASLGLIMAPKLPFLTKAKSTSQVKGWKDDNDDEGSDSESDEESPLKKSLQEGKSKTLDFSLGGDDDDDEDDDGIYNVVKDSTTHLDVHEELQLVEEGRHASRKKQSYKQKIKMLKQSKLITFDEDGNNPEGNEAEEDEDGQQGLNINNALKRLRQEDKIDKEVQRQRVKQEHREKRLKEKQKRREMMQKRRGGIMQEEDEGGEVVLGSPEDDDDVQDDDDDDDSDDEGPQKKRRKMDSDDEEEDDDDDDDDDEEEEEDSDEDSMHVDDDDDDDEEEEESEEEEANPDALEQDEAAVLALLGGNR